MASIITNSKVEDVLRDLLKNEGYSLSSRRGYGETGVDIIAKKGNEVWYIECIGYKSSGPARAKDFYESFFRIVSRLNDGAQHLVIALAKRAEIGLPARVNQHKIAWQRIAVAFPELAIWLVDTDNRTYLRRTWAECCGFQRAIQIGEHMKQNLECLCCKKGITISRPRQCPICGHIFQGNGWDGIDAHWRARHEEILPYEEFWKFLCAKHKN